MNRVFLMIITISILFSSCGVKEGPLLLDEPPENNTNNQDEDIGKDSSLKGLALSIGDYEPIFNSKRYSYTKTVPYKVNSTTVTPKLKDPSSKVQVRINNETYETVHSGSPSNVLTLRPGDTNLVVILVTAKDTHSTSLYTVEVTRGVSVTEGFWKFDEESNETVAKDSSLKNRNLDFVSDGVTFGSTGKRGNAIMLSGTDSYLHNTSVVVNTSEATVSAWVYPTSYPEGDSARIIGFSNDGNASRVFDKTLLLNPDGKPQLYVFCNRSQLFTPIPEDAVPLNTWTHLAGVMDGTKIYLYVNGVEVANAPCTSTHTDYTRANLMIGGRQEGFADKYFQGLIDDAGIWSQGLNSDEVVDLYNNNYPFD